jgi:hypothetical protein
MNVSIPSRTQSTKGHTLLATLATLGVIGLVLISYLRLSANQNQLITRSQVWNSCMALAEAGVDEALNHCLVNGTNLPSNDWVLRGTRYVLTNTLGDGYFVASISQSKPRDIISRGYYPMPGTGTFLSRTVRVGTTNQSVFFAGLVVRTAIELNGNNVLVDSYDSRIGKYNPLTAGDNGDVACVNGIGDALYSGNADIYGTVYTGPTASLRVGPEGGVGTHAWRALGNNGVQPDHWVKDFNMSFPEVTAPFNAAPPPVGGSYNGTNYDNLLGSGNYMTSQLIGKTIVTGTATILVTDIIDLQAGSLEIVAGASLTIYMAGATTKIGTAINGNNSPSSLYYYGLAGNKKIDIKSDGGAFSAAIYAPYAELFINGASQLFGAAMVNTARLVGNCQMHFDEALRGGPDDGLVITSWEEIAAFEEL